MVQEALIASHGLTYEFHAWVVMPTHVHASLTPAPGHPLCDVVRFAKSATARLANQHLGRRGSFWYPDYFDRYMRDEMHFERVRRYIEWNPVKARLCADPTQYSFSSAGFGLQRGNRES